MTCADKLRDLHAEGEYMAGLNLIANVENNRRACAKAYAALPEIAAVIEAAKDLATAAREKVGMVATGDVIAAAEIWHCAGILDEAEAALARRLETQP